MKMRKLGRNGPEVSAVGLGCMGMSAFYGGSDEAQSIAVIHRALDLGVTLFDTAEMYGPHTNEVLVGKALKDRRDKAFIATKFGINRQPDGSAVTDGSPANVRRAVEGSLSRLGVCRIGRLRRQQDADQHRRGQQHRMAQRMAPAAPRQDIRRLEHHQRHRQPQQRRRDQIAHDAPSPISGSASGSGSSRPATARNTSAVTARVNRVETATATTMPRP